jgi:halimadienyl-diphosphate synthase
MDKRISGLLDKLGSSDMLNTAYDTAWVARLTEIDRALGSPAIDWLCRNQLPDGSWGAAHSYYYHDRIISTLSTMIALTYHGKRQSDKALIDKGLRALEKITGTITKDLDSAQYGATVGFEMIVPTLIAEAESLGIITQRKERILKRSEQQRLQKLSHMKGKMISRYVTAAFSSEMAGLDGQHMLDVENLQEKNGSVGCSPSATAYFALQVKKGDQKALDYLYNISRDSGGVPNVAPFDTFEIVWSLWNFSYTPNYINIKNEAQSHIDFLSQSWDRQNGAAFSSEYSVTDSDVSAMVFDTLSRYSIAKKLDSILKFEEKEWFRCYDLENDPSISANIHVLGALRQAGYNKDNQSVSKILHFLRKTRAEEGYWKDKWHISPYYSTAHAIIACADYANEIVTAAVDWLIKTQKQDGAWGIFGPTAEETAYALQALWLWDQKVSHIPKNSLHDGRRWLVEHQDYDYDPLWIGKCLYSPKLVIDSAVITAMKLTEG